MTSLLDNTGLPLWVYILLIVVGSLLILVIVAILVRCWFVRRRAKSPEYNGLTGATRRMTVRRGRMVPTSQHLSLTGSRFGMRQFGLLADNESTMTGRRSPFEWWNGMIDRSQSRQDSISQMEAGSIFTRPSSRATTIATRKEFTATPTTRTPEKTKEPSLRTTELTIPSPSPSPTPSSHRPSINFSRSFAQKVPSSPLTQRSQYTLSRIEESSPPTSASSNSPKPPNRSSYFAAIHPVDSTPLSRPVVENRPTATTVPESLAMATSVRQPFASQSSQPSVQGRDTPSSSLVESRYQDPRRLSGSALANSHHVGDIASQIPLPPRPKTAGASTSSTSRSQPQNQSQNSTPPKLPKALAFPKPVAQTTSMRQEALQNSSMYRQKNQSTPNLSKRSSTASQREGARPSTSKSASRKSSMSIGPSGVVYESQLPDYWSSRTDLQDLRSTLGVIGSDSRASFNSTRRSLKSVGDDGERDNIIGVVTVPGKNNRVLRKKSLRKLQPQKGSSTG